MRDAVRVFIEGIQPHIESSGDDSLWKVRGELQRLKTACGSTPRLKDENILGLIENLLRINEECYFFSVEVRSKLSAESYNKLATLFDIGAIGAIAGHNFLEGDIDISQIITGALSETFVVLGSLQYIEAWNQECETIIDENALRVYDMFWELPREFDRDIDDDNLDELHGGLERFFEQIRDRNLPQGVRIAILQQLYILFTKIYMNKLLKILK
jgi:hypothetical protein